MFTILVFSMFLFSVSISRSFGHLVRLLLWFWLRQWLLCGRDGLIKVSFLNLFQTIQFDLRLIFFFYRLIQLKFYSINWLAKSSKFIFPTSCSYLTLSTYQNPLLAIIVCRSKVNCRVLLLLTFDLWYRLCISWRVTDLIKCAFVRFNWIALWSKLPIFYHATNNKFYVNKRNSSNNNKIQHTFR